MKAVMRIKNFHRLCPRSLKILKKRLTLLLKFLLPS